MNNPPTRIVILGGGFAGATVAKELEEIFQRRSDVDLTVVDQENYSLFTPLLPEVPSGALEAKHIVSPLRAFLRKANVRQAEVKRIDLAERLVIAAHCPACEIAHFPFDHLVLALGSVTNFFGLPGIASHALQLKSLADATSLHAHVIGMFEHASMYPARRSELLTFVVAGGGFAGVETAAELNDFVRKADRYYPEVRKEDVRVVLIHSGPRILPEVSESLSCYALNKLRSRGVEVLLQTKIQSYSDDRIRLSTEETIASRTLIWTAGTKAHPLLSSLELPKTTAGKVVVDDKLQIRGCPGVWAIGDCASVPDLATGRTCPPTAQHAIRQARQLAWNIAAAITGKAPKPFRYRPIGVLAGLGRRSAVAEILGLKFSGFFAWWLWRTAYLLKLPGLDRKVRVALDWTLDLMFPRDVVYLRPLHLAHGSRTSDNTAGDGQMPPIVVSDAVAPVES
jgi:NADH dehydrogenase